MPYMAKLESLPGGQHITTWGQAGDLPVHKINEGAIIESGQTIKWRTVGCMAHFKDLEKGMHTTEIQVGVRAARIVDEAGESQLGIFCQFYSGACKKCLLGKNDAIDSTPCSPSLDGALMVEGVMTAPTAQKKEAEEAC